MVTLNKEYKTARKSDANEKVITQSVVKQILNSRSAGRLCEVIIWWWQHEEVYYNHINCNHGSATVCLSVQLFTKRVCH